MSTEELRPHSRALREAVERSKGNESAPTLLTVKEAYMYLRISNTKLYDLWRSGELESLKIGRRRYFPMQAIKDYIQRQLEKEGG